MYIEFWCIITVFHQIKSDFSKYVFEQNII